jgi:acetylornithine deacetylase/succinyl-diaminopimelate desuccinylase family protein
VPRKCTHCFWFVVSRNLTHPDFLNEITVNHKNDPQKREQTGSLMNKNIFETLIDPRQLIRTTEDLIRIPSFPGIDGQETKVAEYIQQKMIDAGIDCRLEEVIDGRKNVIACLHGTGGGKSLLLCGHTDTVPPYDMPDALNPRLEDGKLFGRGASDMKGPLASMIEALIAVKRSGITLKGELYFVGVIDEELRSYGAVDLIKKGFSADAAIIGEPTNLKLSIAHKGLEWFDFVFKGKTVHGGNQAEGINAISKAAHFINAVETELVPRLARRMDPLLGSSTVNIGVIRGGTQLSTVAGECTVSLDRRFLPSEKYEEVCGELQELLNQLSAQDPDFSCEMKVQDVSVMQEGFVHLPLAQTVDDGFIKLLQEKINLAFEQDTEITSFPAWTDAGLLSGYGKIPTVIFGPGTTKCCHSPAEFITTSELAKASLVYASFAVDYCS